MRARCAALLAAVALAPLAAPAAALAQGDAFGPLAPAPAPRTAPPEGEDGTATGDGGFDGLDALIIAGVAVAVIAGIVLFIARDARTAAPGDRRPGPGGAVALDADRVAPGSRAPARQRASENRRRGRAARRARRQNRPR